MTERQYALHDEIIRISDIFQLGLEATDKDWFYKFILRMNENKIWSSETLFRLDFISNNFFYEFYMPSNFIKYNPLKWLHQIGFHECIKYIPSQYSVNRFTIFIKEIKDYLKEEWIEEKIQIFDVSCLTSNDFVYSNRDKYSAWYYVFQSSSISNEFKERYKHKSIYTDIYDEEGNGNNGTDTAYYDAIHIPIISGIRQSKKQKITQKKSIFQKLFN